MTKEYDKISISFEITDNFLDGGTERTKLERDTSVVNEIETHLEKIIDIFVDFMKTYGFKEETIAKGFREFLEEFDAMK